MVPCAADGTCGPGQVCGALDAKPWCVIPCEGGQCPGGGGCKQYWPLRKEICARVDLGPACDSFTAEATCNTCGLKYFTTECAGNSFCPGRSDCSLPGMRLCSCWNGSPRRCDGQVCNLNDPNDCPAPQYHCNSTFLGTASCVDEPHEYAGKCHCADGRELSVACGETSACEHRCSAGCSLTAQDCPDVGTPKCTYLAAQNVPTAPTLSSHARTACVPQTGSKGLGEPCSRSTLADGGTELGRDDCAKGLVCEAAAAPRGEFRCRKLCTALPECGVGQVCARTVLTVPPSGFCLPDATCTLGGTECGTGRSCMWVRTAERDRLPACKVDGPGLAGAACKVDADCGANLGCGAGVCRETCSATKPCTSGSCPISGTTGGETFTVALCQ